MLVLLDLLLMLSRLAAKFRWGLPPEILTKLKQYLSNFENFELSDVKFKRLCLDREMLKLSHPKMPIPLSLI